LERFGTVWNTLERFGTLYHPEISLHF